jgi:hypothetical protein
MRDEPSQVNQLCLSKPALGQGEALRDYFYCFFPFTSCHGSGISYTIFKRKKSAAFRYMILSMI